MKFRNMYTGMKKLLLVSAFAAMGLSAQAFSLLGPWASWQEYHIGYAYNTFPDPSGYENDPGGPMSLHEGYRWNVPVMTYAIDKSFMEHFGEKGVSEIERAMEHINDVFAHMYDDNYLDEVPVTGWRQNHRAASLGLQDLYTYTLAFMTEQLGLAAPERYMWTLRDQGSFSTVCRNYDPDTLQQTPYINGTLYSFRIDSASVPGAEEDTYYWAQELQYDPVARQNHSVAGVLSDLDNPADMTGVYFTGLTRDDIGGLRWLYSANNYAFEGMNSTGGTSEIQVTDYYNPQIVTNIDLAQFLIAVEDTTNTLSDVQALYPGLNITDYTTTWETYYTTNYSYNPYSVWTPYGQTPVLQGRKESHFRLKYNYKYDNVITNFGGYVTKDQIQYLNIGNGNQISPWWPYGTGTDTNTATNFSAKIDTNRVTGGIMILGGNYAAGTGTGTNDTASTGTQQTDNNQTDNVSTNEVAGYKFMDTNYVGRFYVTNLVASATNTTAATGTTGAETGIGGDGTTTGDTATTTSFEQYVISSFDVYEYIVYPINWVSGGGAVTDDDGGDTTATTTSSVLYRPGLGSNFKMLRVDPDNLVGTTFTETNMYFSNVVYMRLKDPVRDPATDPQGQLEYTTIRRNLTQPDIVIAAVDNGVGGPLGATTPVFQNHSADNYAAAGGAETNSYYAGPGIIVPGSASLGFNKTLNEIWLSTYTESPDVYSGPLSLFQLQGSRSYCWASFDGTTNAPYLYPADPVKTIEWIERQLTNSIPTR